MTGPMGMGGPGGRFGYNYDKIPPPKGFSDLPRYLRTLLGGFFYRLFYIFGIVWKTGPWILFVMSFVAILEGVMPVLGSLISKQIIDMLQAQYHSIGENDYAAFFSGSVMVLLIAFFTYRILQRVITRLNHAVTRIAGEKVVRTVKVQIMEKARELDLASFDRPEFYEKLENANREAGNRPISILSSTFTVVSTVIALVSYITVLATVPGMWWIPIVMIVVSAPSAVVSFIYRKKNYAYMRFRSKDRRQMNYYSEILVNKDVVKEIRMFDLSDSFIERYNKVFHHYYSGLKKLILQENYLMAAVVVLSSVISCCFYAIFAFMVLSGRFMLGSYTLYTESLTHITNNVTSLITTSATIYEGTLFIDNLISFMKEEQTVIPRSSTPLPVSRGTPHEIVFEKVSFSYPGTDRPVLKNLNLTIRPGETLVLVGLNGAGKTTLLKLLTRLYDPTEGRILLDGKDLRDYDVKELYSIFGIIFQDFGKYAVSVHENIRFGDIHKPDSRERVEEAARQSAADEYIEKLPGGYDTPLMRIFEPNGIELSGGQWQKLAIARAFYSDSDILILDEPTASLDPMAEQEVFNQFDRLRADKTTIFVSHRLSSATVASKIVVLEYGEIVEEGTHAELMAAKGRYFTLFSTQAKRYLEKQNTETEDADDRATPPARMRGTRRGRPEPPIDG